MNYFCLIILINFDGVTPAKLPIFLEFARNQCCHHPRANISTLNITEFEKDGATFFQARDLLAFPEQISGPSIYEPPNLHTTARDKYLLSTKPLKEGTYNQILVFGEFKHKENAISKIKRIDELATFTQSLIAKYGKEDCQIRVQVCQANHENTNFFAKQIIPPGSRMNFSAPEYQSVVAKNGSAIDFKGIDSIYANQMKFFYHCVANVKNEDEIKASFLAHVANSNGSPIGDNYDALEVKIYTPI